MKKSSLLAAVRLTLVHKKAARSNAHSLAIDQINRLATKVALKVRRRDTATVHEVHVALESKVAMLDEMAEAESPTAHSRAQRANESGQRHLNSVRQTAQVSEKIGCVRKVFSNSLPRTLRLETKKGREFSRPFFV